MQKFQRYLQAGWQNNRATQSLKLTLKMEEVYNLNLPAPCRPVPNTTVSGFLKTPANYTGLTCTCCRAALASAACSRAAARLAAACAACLCAPATCGGKGQWQAESMNASCHWASSP